MSQHNQNLPKDSFTGTYTLIAELVSFVSAPIIVPLRLLMVLYTPPICSLVTWNENQLFPWYFIALRLCSLLNIVHYPVHKLIYCESIIAKWTLLFLFTYLDLNQVNRFHKSGLTRKLASVHNTSACWDDLSTTSVDSISVKGHIHDVKSYTSHVFFTKYTLQQNVSRVKWTIYNMHLQ